MENNVFPFTLAEFFCSMDYLQLPFIRVEAFRELSVS